MDDRFNTAAGWILFAGIIGLGFAILSGKYFHADKPERPDPLGYVIEGVETAAGGPAEMGIVEALNMDGMEPSKGEAVFAKCTACHTVEQGGADGVGPNLYGIMGKAIGAGSPGFAYSPALSDKGGEWDWDAMSEWLKSPRRFADGTKMSFAGLSSVEDRAAVMLYMNANGSSLPVPEFVADVAAESDGEGTLVAEAEAEADADLEGEAAAEQDAAAEENEGGA
ncbi:MAG: c-type cytochrome [Erythrobacter sp.]